MPAILKKRNKPILTKSENDRASITITVKAGPWVSEMKIKVAKMDPKDFNKIYFITRKYSKKL